MKFLNICLAVAISLFEATLIPSQFSGSLTFYVIQNFDVSLFASQVTCMQQRGKITQAIDKENIEENWIPSVRQSILLKFSVVLVH